MRTWPLLLTVVLLGCDDGPASPEPDGALIDPAVVVAGQAVTAGRVLATVAAIADDSMAGRETPGAGLDATAAYLAAQLEAAGLEPAGTDGFYARFDFDYTTRDGASVLLGLSGGGGPSLDHGADFVMIGSAQVEGAGQVVWGGAAEDTPDAGGLDLTGRVVLYDLAATRFDEPAVAAVFHAEQVVSQAVARGFVVPDAFTEAEMARAVSRTERWTRRIPTFWVRESAAASLLAAGGGDLAALRAAGPQSTAVALTARGALIQRTGTPPNVVARLRGSDSSLRAEHVLVSAHYDHLGVGLPDADGDTIYNGADDNASGTAAVLEVARALASLDRRPARSVLFVFFSGEEHGLLGSRAFVASPTVPLSGIVANVNLDMVGRNDPATVQGVGARFTGLGAVADSITAAVDLGLSVISSPANDGAFGASDQFAFVCHQVPALLLHTGLHDQYHEASDEVERLDTDKVARVARLALHLAHRVATVPARPAWTAEGQTLLNELGACAG